MFEITTNNGSANSDFFLLCPGTKFVMFENAKGINCQFFKDGVSIFKTLSPPTIDVLQNSNKRILNPENENEYFEYERVNTPFEKLIDNSQPLKLELTINSYLYEAKIGNHVEHLRFNELVNCMYDIDFIEFVVISGHCPFKNNLLILADILNELNIKFFLR